MNRKLRDDLVATGIEPQAAVVLASVIPDVSAIDELSTDLHRQFDELGETMDRGFANLHRELDRQRNLTIGSTVLIIAVNVAAVGILVAALGG